MLRGCAGGGARGADLEEALAIADAEMYRAKRTRKVLN